MSQKLHQKPSQQAAAGGKQSLFSLPPQQMLEQARALISQERLQEAETLCAALLTSDITNPEVYNLLGIIAKRRGDANAAIAHFSRALDIKPENSAALYNLGNIMREAGHEEQALELYESAVFHEPKHYASQHKLQELYISQGRYREAFCALRELVPNSYANDTMWQRMNDYAGYAQKADITDEFLELCTQMLVERQLQSASPGRVIFKALNIRYPELAILQSNNDEPLEVTKQRFQQATFIQLINTPLFKALFGFWSTTSFMQEKFLQRMRRALLEVTMDNSVESLASDNLNFLAHLARNQFNNEFVALVTDEEKTLLASLEQRAAAEDTEVWDVLLLAAYRPLYKEGQAEHYSKILKSSEDPLVVDLATYLIDEPKAQMECAREIEALTDIEDVVSKSVREQYEESPYPRWNATLGLANFSLRSRFEQLLPYVDASQILSPEHPEILVAGCGTGQHALQVGRRYPRSSVLAVDLSLASLGYALYKKREHKVENVQLGQADILKLRQLERSFDMIECAGVLHHMQDPMAGWQVLTDILKPQGTMKIALYSKTARQSVIEAREEIAKEGIPDDLDSIRAYRQRVMQEQNPNEIAKYTQWRDFYSLSECRDLLFHRQEHQFTIPMIKEAVARLGLEFMCFEHGIESNIQLYKEAFPGDKTLANLDNWQELEEKNPNLFMGMYQFWLYKPA